MSDHTENRPGPADVKAMTKALAAPFELAEVKFKPQAVKNNRALALAYVDARHPGSPRRRAGRRGLAR